MTSQHSGCAHRRRPVHYGGDAARIADHILDFIIAVRVADTEAGIFIFVLLQLVQLREPEFHVARDGAVARGFCQRKGFGVARAGGVRPHERGKVRAHAHGQRLEPSKGGVYPPQHARRFAHEPRRGLIIGVSCARYIGLQAVLPAAFSKEVPAGFGGEKSRYGDTLPRQERGKARFVGHVDIVTRAALEHEAPGICVNHIYVAARALIDAGQRMHVQAVVPVNYFFHGRPNHPPLMSSSVTKASPVQAAPQAFAQVSQ